MLHQQQSQKSFLYFVPLFFFDPQDIGRFREEHSMDYSDLAVFHGITNNEVDAMIHCFCMRRARYESGETICTYGEGGGEVVVEIEVRPNGRITSARALSGRADYMREVACRAALESTLDINPQAPPRQRGTITYIFIPQ